MVAVGEVRGHRDVGHDRRARGVQRREGRDGRRRAAGRQADGGVVVGPRVGGRAAGVRRAEHDFRRALAVAEHLVVGLVHLRLRVDRDGEGLRRAVAGHFPVREVGRHRDGRRVGGRAVVHRREAREVAAAAGIARDRRRVVVRPRVGHCSAGQHRVEGEIHNIGALAVAYHLITGLNQYWSRVHRHRELDRRALTAYTIICIGRGHRDGAENRRGCAVGGGERRGVARRAVGGQPDGCVVV